MSDVSYRPLIEDMVWSYSRIECFNDCPYKWFLKYIRKQPEAEKFYSSFGSFMHKLIEEYYRGEISKQEMKTKYLFGFKENIKGELPADTTVGKYIQQGLDYIETFEDFPYEILDIEKRVVFDIDGIPFVGFIDFLAKKDGDLYIIDSKSRELKPRSKRKQPTQKDKELDELLKQQYIYSAAIKQEYGVFPKALCINCFRNKQFIVEPFNEERYNETIQWVKDTIEEIKNAEDFHPNIEYFACRYLCGLSDDCYYWERRGY